MSLALLNRAPRTLAFAMVPPLPAEPVPVTENGPVDPVLLRRMAVEAPADEMLRNVNPAAPIVVSATFSAVPEPDLSVLPVPVAVTVPPPVAVNAAELLALVSSVSVLANVNVAPVLFSSRMPSLLDVDDTVPPNKNVPPVLFWTSIARPSVVLAIDPM